MFPGIMMQYSLIDQDQRIFNPNIVGLTIDNTSLELDDNFVKIFFQHDDIEVSNSFIEAQNYRITLNS